MLVQYYPASLLPMPATWEVPYRAAVFTFFCPDGFAISELPQGLDYIGYGIEHAPTTGRLHLQGFCYSRRAKKLTGWRKCLNVNFPGCHIEKMQGTFRDNDMYCTKESSLIEFGLKPMHDGQRAGDLYAKDLIDADPSVSVVEHWDRTNEPALMHYHKFFENYREYKRRKISQYDLSAPEVYYIHGKSGSGKTRFVYEKEPDVANIDQGLQWFDAYEGAEAVLFDNLEKPIANKALFLRLTDRYPFKVPIKGGHTWWKPKRIYITSVHDPEVMCQQFSESTEFFRRVTVFKQM